MSKNLPSTGCSKSDNPQLFIMGLEGMMLWPCQILNPSTSEVGRQLIGLRLPQDFRRATFQVSNTKLSVAASTTQSNSATDKISSTHRAVTTKSGAVTVRTRSIITIINLIHFSNTNYRLATPAFSSSASQA